MMLKFQAAVIGAGPAGAACAAALAQGGWRVAVIEREAFPREKVCGDCLNPACWPVLERLGCSDAVRALPQAALDHIIFGDARRDTVRLPLPAGAERAVPRSLFDAALLRHAQNAGAELITGALTGLESAPTGWRLTTSAGQLDADWLIAADGRNSTVLRLLDLAPAAHRDRVGVQTHFPLPAGRERQVAMRFLPEGYSGFADVGGGLANLCLVGRAGQIAGLKKWALDFHQLPSDQPWRSIAPLARAAVSPLGERLLLVGDAARVVEPFTGEGIYYALASAECAAAHLLAGSTDRYPSAHAALYRGRLWLNRLARVAVENPRLGRALLSLGKMQPALFSMLTRKVIGTAARVTRG